MNSTDPPKPPDPDVKLDEANPWENPAAWLMTMPVQRHSQTEGTITQVAGRMPVQSLSRTQMLHIERPHGETIRCVTGRLSVSTGTSPASWRSPSTSLCIVRTRFSTSWARCFASLSLP